MDCRKLIRNILIKSWKPYRMLLVRKSTEFSRSNLKVYGQIDFGFQGHCTVIVMYSNALWSFSRIIRIALFLRCSVHILRRCILFRSIMPQTFQFRSHSIFFLCISVFIIPMAVSRISLCLESDENFDPVVTIAPDIFLQKNRFICIFIYEILKMNMKKTYRFNRLF